MGGRELHHTFEFLGILIHLNGQYSGHTTDKRLILPSEIQHIVTQRPILELGVFQQKEVKFEVFQIIGVEDKRHFPKFVLFERNNLLQFLQNDIV